jgi:dTDP-4-dehydrorhamnose reductase
VARACAEIGAALLYVSTDYVFDGSQGRPYREDDCPHPRSVYGYSKLRGEQLVQGLVARHCIVRTSWLYGPQGKNFVATILKLAREREELRVVSDQRGSPTFTRHLARKLEQLARAKACGIYHVTGAGHCSWFEFAQAIVKAGGYNRVRVAPITSQDLGRPAPRPANSVLENRRLLESGLGALPPWTEGLAQYLEEGRRSGELDLVAAESRKDSLQPEGAGR